MPWPLPDIEPPGPTRVHEVHWLEPYPDALLEGLPDTPPGPEARYETSEAISLAFITRANGQLAFGAYLHRPSDGVRHAVGLLVVTITGDRISAMTRFDNSGVGRFGLPRTLPG